MATATTRPGGLPSGTDDALGGASLRGEVWKQLRRDRLASIGLVVLGLLVLMALLGKLLTEWIVVFDPGCAAHDDLPVETSVDSALLSRSCAICSSSAPWMLQRR